jgi:hypothetical protein
MTAQPSLLLADLALGRRRELERAIATRRLVRPDAAPRRGLPAV